MQKKTNGTETYYVTFYTSVMSPVDHDMAFNSLLVKIIEITDFFYYVKSLFKDSNGDIRFIKLLIPAGNIAALIEVENGVYEELEKKYNLKKDDNLIKISSKKEVQENKIMQFPNKKQKDDKKTD